MHILLCEKHRLFPAHHGRAARLLSLAAALVELGHRVTILSIRAKPHQSPSGVNLAFTPNWPWPLRDLAFLRQLGKIHRRNPIDVVQVQNSLLVLFALRARRLGFKVAFEAIIVEKDFWESIGRNVLLARWMGRILHLAERAIVRRSSLVMALSPQDAARLSELHRLGTDAVHVIPLWIDGTSQLVPPPGGKPRALFLGSYTHRANREAIGYLLEEIWPKIRERNGDATLVLVGRSMPMKLGQGERVQVHPDVADVSEHLRQASVCIAPLRTGSGVRTKILEYWAHGKPVVATPAAAEGLTFEDGVDLLVRKEAGGFADAVLQLLKDEPLRRRLATGGLERLRRFHSRPVALAALRQAYPASPHGAG